MYFDVSELTRHDAHKLIIGSVVPRPIAWVSTLSADGIGNLAPFSFFMAASSLPPTLVVSVGSRDGRPKDTLKNVQDVPEMVVHITNEELAQKMNATSAEVGPEVDELALAGLTAVPSTHVRPVRVAEAPVQMECRVVQLVPLGGPGANDTLIIGEILAFHIKDELYDPETRRIRQKELHAIARLAGDGYARSDDQFDMARPDRDGLLR